MHQISHLCGSNRQILFNNFTVFVFQSVVVRLRPSASPPHFLRQFAIRCWCWFNYERATVGSARRWMHVCKYARSVPLHGEPSLSCCVISSVYLQHLHSWCLQRSRQTKGGEHWCFLQVSDMQPVETPCEVTTWIPSEGSSWSRGMERPLNLKSRKQPGGRDETERKKRGL